MVIDDVSRLGLYGPLVPGLEQVAAFLERPDLSSLPDGRYELKGGGYVNLQTVCGKSSGEAVLESHRKMIDVQVPLSGDETIGYASLGRLTEAIYDASSDISFHKERPDSLLNVRRGMFAVFFPQDSHAPCIAEGPLRKAVFKIPVAGKCKQVI